MGAAAVAIGVADIHGSLQAVAGDEPGDVAFFVEPCLAVSERVGEIRAQAGVT